MIARSFCRIEVTRPAVVFFGYSHAEQFEAATIARKGSWYEQRAS
jgi:hypothetical protein